jgi:hypothetical protein
MADFRYPLKVTKSMGKKKVARRSKVKPFIKVVNYAHLLPTRYMLELETLKGSVSNDTFKEPSQREDAKKSIKKAFEERYAKGNNRWCEFVCHIRETYLSRRDNAPNSSRATADNLVFSKLKF